jgi:hypothetical protein
MLASSCYNKNINTKNIRNNNSSNNKLLSKECISIPIPIPNAINKIKNNDEYSLNYNIFNPGKMSPPDLWKNRLKQRLYNSEIMIDLNE